MPFRHISDETKHSIGFLLRLQPYLTIPEVAYQTSVSTVTVQRVSSNLFYYSKVFAPSSTQVKRGRPSKISEEVEDWIIHYLYNRPYSLLQEVAFEPVRDKGGRDSRNVTVQQWFKNTERLFKQV